MTWANGDWMVTASGVHAYPTDPEATEINIYDIAHALGRICRFGGHVKVPHYSVAQHSVLVSRIVPPELALTGLLHDAAEAYIGDVVKPFKRNLGVYAAGGFVSLESLERKWWRRIAEKFGALRDMPRQIKDADMRALWTERRDVMAPNSSVPGGAPLDVRIKPLCSKRATAEFMARFIEVKR
jgi:hypothetical protein